MIDVRLKITLGIGLLIGGLAMAVTLSGSPLAVARVNTAEHTLLGTTQHQIHACQSREVLPRETSAIRLRAWAFIGPRVTVRLSARGHVIADGERESGWTGGVVTIPVNPLSTARSAVDLCFTFFVNGEESLQLVGEPTAPGVAARTSAGPLPGRVRAEYLRPAGSSWWSRIPSVARRMGLGRAASGTWNALLVVILMGGVVVVCSRVILRELG